MMNARILALATASFAMGTEAFVYAGHLEALARDLNVSVATAGQLAAAFALTSAVAGPFVAEAVTRFDRRKVILVGLVLIGLLNILAALQSSFIMLVAIRFLCGVAAGLVGPISSVAAAELVPPERRGRAMAVMLGGVTLAFVLGVPMGSVIGDFVGWRGTFVFAGLVAFVAALVIALALPSIPGCNAARTFTRADLSDRNVMLGLALTLVGFAGSFTIVAYIGPLTMAIAGLSGSGIGLVQALIGVGSIVGIVLGGQVAGKARERTVLICSVLMAILTGLAYAGLLRSPFTSIAMGGVHAPAFSTSVLVVCMVLGAASLFTRIPIVQTRLANGARPEARPVVFALNSSMVFLGQGLGAMIGGSAIWVDGLWLIGAASAVVNGIALAIVIADHRAKDAAAMQFPSEAR